MAIINHSRNFIFVHVPKAAGTSVTNALAAYSTYCDLEIGGSHFGEQIQSAYKKRFKLYKHAPASEIRDVIGSDKWDAAYKFSIVRNPYDRVVSTYKFLNNWEGTPEEFKKKLKVFTDINEYIESDIWKESDGPDSIFRPQTYWLTDVNDRSKLIVDFVGRLENLDEDLATIKSTIEKVPVAVSESPRLNASQGESILNAKSIAKINKWYARDFEFWKYPRIEQA